MSRPSARERITAAARTAGWTWSSEYAARIVRYERDDAWITVVYSGSGTVTRAMIADGSGVLFRPGRYKAEEILDAMTRQYETGD